MSDTIYGLTIKLEIVKSGDHGFAHRMVLHSYFMFIVCFKMMQYCKNVFVFNICVLNFSLWI